MFKKFLTLALGGFFCFILATSNAQATTIIVTTFEDELNSDGDCSLREAVQAANTNTPIDACSAGSTAETDVIQLAAGTYSVELDAAQFPQDEDLNNSGDLDIRGNLVIRGVADHGTILDGNKTNRILEAHEGTDTELILEDLVFQNGQTNDNGGVVRFPFTTGDADLTVRRCHFINNIAKEGGALLNENDGNLLIEESLFFQNRATKFGGALAAFTDNRSITIKNSAFHANQADEKGGAIETENLININIFNSTFSKNSAVSTDPNVNAAGGAIHNQSAQITLVHVSFVNNSASGAGQTLFNEKGANEDDSSNIFLKNTFIAQDNNPNAACIDDDNNSLNQFGAIQSLGFNIYPDASCPQVVTDQVFSFADLNLGPLQDNGGLTPTHALLAESAAIAAGNCQDTQGNLVEEDQRGFARPVQNCDIGAFQTGCGDLIVLTPEQCDDGNTEGGDGCSADCSQVEEGFTCPAKGGACEPLDGGNGDGDGDGDAGGCNLSFIQTPGNQAGFWFLLFGMLPFLIIRTRGLLS